MKKCLKKDKPSLYHIKNGARVEGLHPDLRGDVSGLRGNISGLRGDVTGLTGYVDGLTGNIDDAKLTTDDRERGVNVTELELSDASEMGEAVNPNCNEE